MSIMDTPYEQIVSALEALSSFDRDAVLGGGEYREMFIDNISITGVTPTQIDFYISKVAAHQNGDVVVLKQLDDAIGQTFEDELSQAVHNQELLKEHIRAYVVQEQVANGLTFDEATAYQPTKVEYQSALQVVRHKHGIVPNKHEILLNAIEETLENATTIYGRPDLTKTQILQACRKDKGTWRGVASETLTYLAAKNRITKVGARYHHKNTRLRMVETDFTRKVFESLYGGGRSINAIVKRIGYDNVFGRKKVRQTLDFLEREGLVTQTNYKWSQNALYS